MHDLATYSFCMRCSHVTAFCNIDLHPQSHKERQLCSPLQPPCAPSTLRALYLSLAIPFHIASCLTCFTAHDVASPPCSTSTTFCSAVFILRGRLIRPRNRTKRSPPKITLNWGQQTCLLVHSPWGR